MKKQFKLTFIFLMMALALITITGCDQAKKSDIYENDKTSKTVTWGVKSDMKLFGLLDIKDNEIKGFDIDIAKELSKTMFGNDVKVNLVPVTSNTRLPLLKSGNIDAICATMTITEERKKVIDFSESYFNAGQAIMVKKGSPIRKVTDLKAGTKVIGLTGSNSVQNIKNAAPDTTVIQMPDSATAFAALKAGQADAMTTDNGILYGLISEDKGYEVVGGTFTKEPYGIAVDKGQEKFVTELNKALDKIKQNGTYSKIVKKWFGQFPEIMKEVQ